MLEGGGLGASGVFTSLSLVCDLGLVTMGAFGDGGVCALPLFLAGFLSRGVGLIPVSSSSSSLSGDSEGLGMGSKSWFDSPLLWCSWSVGAGV